MDAGAGLGDTIGTGKEVSNNRNNIDESRSGKVDKIDKDGVDETNKGGVGGTDKGVVGGTNIKAGVGVGRADKSGIGKTDKGDVGGANIEIGKKAGIRAVASINNSVNSGGKVTDQHVGLVTLIFTTLATANSANNSNLAIPEKTLLGAATSTSDEFLITFAAFANITLEREQMCECNPFLFAANHQ